MEDPKHTSVRVGDVLAGKYRVDGVLGAGGMGVVVAAHHLQLDERVALKFLLPDALANEEAVMRFEQEARAAVKITSEHVARVIDVGALESGAPYIVMELLEGSDLSAWIREKGGLPVEQAVEFVLQACEAIAEAHSLGIVHRDLKPANLFVVRRRDGIDSVKVLDFGISKVRKNEINDMSGTKTSVIMGSPFYMSPEQMRASKDVDPQSDIWALGVILYELLAGHTPFAAETYAETCVRVMTEPAVSLREVRPDVPAALAAAVHKCLEKDRLNRHADVAELAMSLREFSPRRAKASIERINAVLGRERASLASPRIAPSHGPIATMSPFGRTTGGVPAKRKSAWGITAATAAIVLFATAAGAFALGRVHPGAFSSTGAAAAFLQWAPPPNHAPEVVATADPVPNRSDAPTTTLAPPPVAAALPAPAVDIPSAPVVDVPSAPAVGVPSAPPLEAAPAPASGPAPGPPPEPARRRAATFHMAPSWRALPASAPLRVSQSVADAEAAPTASPAAVPTPPRSPGVDCDTPFYFDASGTRIFKKECVH
jgi:serine/threonine protein kinase